MAVANRSARLRRLADRLTKQYELGYRDDERINAEYNESRRTWAVVWHDGPTLEQVKRAARKADAEVLEGVYFARTLTSRAIALGVIRATLAAGPEKWNDYTGRPSVSELDGEELLRTVSKPQPRDDREAALVDAVIAEADGDHGQGWATNYEVCRLIADKGLAHFLRRSGAEMTPLETLTDRYLPSGHALAWQFRLETMTALHAFAAVQADPKASPEAVAAALGLVPELHAAIDAAAAELAART